MTRERFASEALVKLTLLSCEWKTKKSAKSGTISAFGCIPGELGKCFQLVRIWVALLLKRSEIQQSEVAKVNNATNSLLIVVVVEIDISAGMPDQNTFPKQDHYSSTWH